MERRYVIPIPVSTKHRLLGPGLDGGQGDDLEMSHIHDGK